MHVAQLELFHIDLQMLHVHTNIVIRQLKPVERRLMESKIIINCKQ